MYAFRDIQVEAVVVLRSRSHRSLAGLRIDDQIESTLREIRGHREEDQEQYDDFLLDSVCT